MDTTQNNSRLKFRFIKAFGLPKKHAGVGLARKIGMDEAAWRLKKTKNPVKIIACFDADATCSKNYLIELEKLWLKYPETTSCSIRYEHPLDGNDFNKTIYSGIAQYELHLRYYVAAGQYIGHPFSYQTVGSSMACSADAYLRFGGMNKNKAGEDFYFLQKIIPHGNFRELNSATVYPSPRPSYRVPFGTGRAMTKFIESESEVYHTYNLSSFLSLKDFLKDAPQKLYQAKIHKINEFLSEQPEILKNFLSSNNFVKAITEINENTSNASNFTKRFFLWFDAFKLLKYLNLANEIHFKRQPIFCEAKKLAKMIGIDISDDCSDVKELLLHYRLWDSKPYRT